MATALQPQANSPGHKRPPSRINLVSVAVLFIAIVAIALMLVGIAVRGSSPLFLLFPVALGVFCILDLRK